MSEMKIVIVGASECGARAAFSLREHGFEGSIDLIGSEPHAPYERPPLSKSSLLEGLSHKPVAGPEQYLLARINLMTGCEVEAIKPRARRVVLHDGKELPYGKLLLATGARARTLPDIPSSSRLIRTFRTANDALGIRERLGAGQTLVVIGGGFIGLELAATARRMGTAVILLETKNRVLTRGVHPEVATIIANRHLAEGVDLRCGVVIEGIEEMEDAARVIVRGSPAINADLVVIGIGAIPNVELAEAAGLQIDNGIAVNAFLQTSDPDIYAAGDCCSFPTESYGGRRIRLEAWRSAQYQGIRAARNMLGHSLPISDVPWFWSDQYDLVLQVAGLPGDATSQQIRRSNTDSLIVFDLAPDGRLLAASGVSTGVAVARDIRIAEMMIARGTRPDQAALADPSTKLQVLLKQS